MRSSRLFVGLIVSMLGIGLNILSANAYEVMAVTGGGTIKGKVVFSGAPPPARKIIPTKDREACGGIREKPQIVLAPDREVQDAVVYLKKVERGKAWEKPVKTSVLDNQKCEFVPYLQVIPDGSDLEIINSDPVLHTVHGFFDKHTVFNMAMIKRTRWIASSLKGPGMMRFECDSHGWMRAWLYVAENPYYAITPKDGTFTIAGVPSGSYVLVVWHEYTGPVEIPVTVKGNEILALTAQLKK